MGRTPTVGPEPNPPIPHSQRWLTIPYRNLLRAAPSMGGGGTRAGEAGIASDERRFTPPNIEARPSASGARSRSYT